jgi:hypothetical protein
MFGWRNFIIHAIPTILSFPLRRVSPFARDTGLTKAKNYISNPHTIIGFIKL